MEKQIENIKEFQERIAETKEGSLLLLKDEEFEKQARLRINLIKEELNELEVAIFDLNIVECLDAITDLDYVIKGTAHELGLLDKLEKAWDLVHKNNMTKLGPDGKVVKNENGKVIKPKGYKPVNLNQLFNEY